MDVLLVDSHLVDQNAIIPSLGLAYLASMLDRNYHNVKMLDFYIKDSSKIKTIKEFRKVEEDFYNQIETMVHEFGIIGVSCTSTSYFRALEIVKVAKYGNEDIITIMGGAHVTLMQKYFKNKIFSDSKYLDIVVEGDGENPLLEISDKFPDLSGIPNISFFDRDKNELVNNANICYGDINDYGIPAWKFFDLSHYKRLLPIIASRGCKYHCAFCDERTLNKKYRNREPSLVFNELKRNVEEYGIKAFWFSDSSLTSYPYLEELLDLMIAEKENRNFEIACSSFARANEISDNLLKKMKKAGFVLLYFGLESGSQNILNYMRKGLKRETIKEAVNLAKKNGILTDGSFIIGFPGETTETALETIRFAKELNCDLYAWHIFMPSFEMIASKEKWNLDFYKDFDWKNFQLDMPSHLIEEIAKKYNEVIYDRHFPSEMVLSHHQLPDVEFKIHSTMRYIEAALLVQLAIQQTKETGDLDDLYILLQIYDK